MYACCLVPLSHTGPGGGGGGTLSIYTGVCVPRHIQKGGGVLGTGTTKKRGLRHGKPPKRGVLGMGTSRKRGGVLRTGLVKKTILVTDVAQKGFLGVYL